MKNVGTIISITLAIAFCFCLAIMAKHDSDNQKFWNDKYVAQCMVAKQLSIGQVFPDSLKLYLMESTVEFEKWKIDGKYFTIKNNKIVSIWRDF
jgi:hypothetical protein